MNIEEIVISLIGDYKHAGFTEANTEQRQAFLAVLAFILVSKTHQSDLDNDLLGGIEHLIHTSSDITPVKQSHTALLEEIRRYHTQSESLIRRSLESLLPIVQGTSLQGIPALIALEIYDRTLQRLQKMNVDNRVSKTFQYDYFPVELAKLVASVAEGKQQLDTFVPWDEDGRLTGLCCSLSDIAQVAVTVESQSPVYINQMLSIAGVNSSTVSSNKRKPKRLYDLSIVLQPMHTNPPTGFDIEQIISNQLEALNDDGTAIAFVGQSLLVGKQHQKFRNSLISNNHVKHVIELPAKLLAPTAPALFALILCKENQSNKIVFENHSDSFEPKGRLNALTETSIGKDERAIAVALTVDKDSEPSLMPRSYMPMLLKMSKVQATETLNSRAKLRSLQDKNDHLLAQLALLD